MGGPGGTQAFQNWQYLPPEGVGQPGTVQGGWTPEPFFRNQMDAQRSMWRRTPDAEYPDGYLGTISSRRGDRVLDTLKGRLNEKQYQRGVHKGVRIDPGDYYWPDKFQPDRGLRNEVSSAVPTDAGVLVRRQAPVGTVVPAMGQEMVFDSHGTGFNEVTQGQRRQAQLRKLAPPWSGGGNYGN